jgi:hypothetical protein
MTDKRHDAEYMTDKLGTCSDIYVEMGVIYFLDFEPAEGFPMPAGDCLSINDSLGEWEVRDDKGNSIAKGTVRPVFVRLS